MLILYLLIQKANSLSEYQFGVQILDCQKSSVQINFPKQFEQTPQIIITQSEMYSLRNGINFRFEIGSITTKSYPLIKNLGFTIYQGCLQNIKQVNIKWYAIDDQIIQVIDCYNRDDPKNETFNHNNLNALNGFLTLTSFYYISSVSFNIDVFLCIFEIIEITPFNVTVGISKTDSLKQIGYQIILGKYSAIQDVQIAFPKQPDKFFISPFLGFNLTPNDAIQIIQSQDETSDLGKLIYKIYELPGDVLYSKNVHQRIWISKTFTAFKSLTYKLIQIVQKSYVDQDIIQSSIQIKFAQENPIFKESGNYRILLDKSTQFINVFFQLI